jgi:hypothetical protein
MKHNLGAALAAAILLGAASAAQAALVIDKSALIPVGLGTLGNSGIRSNFSQVQTVTAGETGLLSRIDLQLWQVGDPVTYSLSIYAGDYADAFDFPIDDGPPGSPGGFGTLIGTISVSSATLPTQEQNGLGALASFDVSAFGYYVQPGQVFSLLSQTNSTRSGVAWTLGYYLDDTDADSLVDSDYAGGYNAFQYYDETYVRSRSDRSFRTWVDVTSVPEPHEWALLILGFGLTGAGLRHRRISAASA